MSALLGFEKGVNYTNDIVNRNIALQRNIQSVNNLNKEINVNKRNVANKLQAGLEKSGALSEAKGQGVDFLNDARNVYKEGKALGKIYTDTAKAVSTARAGGGVISAEVNPARVGRLYSDAQRTLAEGRSAVSGVAGASNLSELVGEGSKVVSSVKKITGALDSVGKVGEGLGVVSGISDISKDTGGGFAKMNVAEKVGNVAGIGSGALQLGSLATGLESAGALLDTTGFGAEIGIGLGVAGAVVGGVSAVADYVGGKSKQKKPSSAPMPAPLPSAPAPTNVLQSGGVASSSYS